MKKIIALISKEKHAKEKAAFNLQLDRLDKLLERRNENNNGENNV